LSLSILNNLVMKLHTDTPLSLNTVTAYASDYIEINKNKYFHSIILFPRGAVIDWQPKTLAELTPEHFAAVLQVKPEVILFGSGAALRFPSPELIVPLIQAGFGVETMDTQAACRTYNILMAEGRLVAAALLLEVAA
jgi:uncharacterized protein